jgi:hypothetical protein
MSTYPVSASHRIFHYAQAPKDDGSGHEGRTLRIFAIGHTQEDLAVGWLRAAGFDLYTRKGNRPDGGQVGFSVAGGRIRGHVRRHLRRRIEAAGGGLSGAVGMQDHEREVVEGDGAEGGWFCRSRCMPRNSPSIRRTWKAASRLSANPALFTAINKDTAELHHELVPFDGHWRSG